MFRGASTVSLDSKGRLAIPSCFREQLRKLADGRLVQTLSPLDRALWLYPAPEWELIEEKLAKLSDFDRQSRRTKQMMQGHVTECQLDTHGRILISSELRDYARLDKRAVFLGQGNKFEVWNKPDWEEQRDHWLNLVGDEEGTPSEALLSLSL